MSMHLGSTPGTNGLGDNMGLGRSQLGGLQSVSMPQWTDDPRGTEG